MAAARDAARERESLALFTAWHVEAFARAKRLPKLDALLNPKPAAAAPLHAKVRHIMAAFPRADA